MTAPRLDSCPFCGFPRPAVRTVWARPAADPSDLAGFEAYCGACAVRLYRPWEPSVTRVSVQRAVATGWNRRADSPWQAVGFRPCPLCGSPRVVATTDVVRWQGHPTRLEDAVRCEECRLLMTPGWHDWQGRRLWQLHDLELAWNTRQGPYEWRLLAEVAPSERRVSRVPEW